MGKPCEFSGIDTLSLASNVECLPANFGGGGGKMFLGTHIRAKGNEKDTCFIVIRKFENVFPV